MIIESRTNFIKQLISEELANGKHQSIVTRFPPEPNGYLHIGHAKSICLNFGLAELFNGKCFLRFDDTNPLKEEEEFVQAIIKDVQWLGFNWCDITYSSDYYEQLYFFAVELIKQNLAYVDSLTSEEIREHRGTLQQPGRESTYRNRTCEENLDLFKRMKAGEFADGSHVLRAKIDMQSGNLNMRDPIIYRIRHAKHQRTGDSWCIYPMYDFAHPISDALEKVTHSLCTLEFQDHRPLYNWFIEHLSVPAKPVQTEFSRLNLSHTITSKRKLRELVEKNVVTGWDDPRMPTICGMRKRGYPPAAIRAFCEAIGVSKADAVIDMTILEECVRNELNQTAKRALCVLDPIEVVIEDLAEDHLEILSVPYKTNDPNSEMRNLHFSREIYIDRNDFMEIPSKGYFRLAVGSEVRLRHAYVIKCHAVDHNDQGEVVRIRCTYDVNTLGKNPEGRKVKGVIHWVSKQHASLVDIYQYDRLFTDENPASAEDYLNLVNPNSLRIQKGLVEAALMDADVNEIFQFERVGYYTVHAKDTQGKITSFHRIVDLKSKIG